MAEESEGREYDAQAAGSGVDPVAAAIALGGASRTEADAFLRQQRSLIADQHHHLREQFTQIRLSIFNQRLSIALKVLTGVVGLAVLAGLCAAIWNASRADGLVVEAFSVPPQFAQAGIGGDVLADDITDKVTAIRDLATRHSLDDSKDVSKDRAGDIKVEIPETGVSLGEAWRYLRLWFGHERRMNGNLRLAGDGKIALTVALDGEPAFTLTGAPGDLDGLEQQAAERVFAGMEPINIVLYLEASGRVREALAASERATRVVNNPPQMSDAYSLMSYETRRLTGDMARARELVQVAMASNPKAVAPHVEVVRDSIVLGHDEEGLEQAREIQNFHREDQPPQQRGRGFDEILQEAANERDTETGDFLGAAGNVCDADCSFVFKALLQAEYAARLHDGGQSRALIGQALAVNPAARASRARYFLDIDLADWPAAASDARAYAATLGDGSAANARSATGDAKSPRLAALVASTQALPLLAYALARGGDFAAAHAAIDRTPADCYDCLRVRGEIDALEKNWNGAGYWFARALRAGPSVPFAYADWGQALLAQGDPDGAIAKFAAANQKGPHFADPLEQWGEALAAQKHTDDALAKFEEAEKYAPNWGRLHLKWGEALAAAGNPEEAKAQLARAARLDLTQTEKSELGGVPHG